MIHLLDVVALIDEHASYGLHRGQVGTVVECLAPGVFEVAFLDDEGREYASLPLPEDQLPVLQYEPIVT